MFGNNDNIYLEDDSNEEESKLSFDDLDLTEVVETIKELFEVKRELDDVVESVVCDLIDIFTEQENKYVEHIADIEQENKELKQIIDDLNQNLASNSK